MVDESYPFRLSAQETIRILQVGADEADSIWTDLRGRLRPFVREHWPGVVEIPAPKVPVCWEHQKVMYRDEGHNCWRCPELGCSYIAATDEASPAFQRLWQSEQQHQRQLAPGGGGGASGRKHRDPPPPPEPGANAKRVALSK